MTNYTPGSLANTGILNYFNEGDGDGQKSFNLLRSAVALSKSKYVQAFLSVGGWNYSCNFAVYGELCGDAPTAENGIHYDFFPDPLDAQEKATASVAYSNIIKLSNDLGVDGIDLDAEEFWHADKYAVQWNDNPWSSSIARDILSNGGPTYDSIVKYGTGTTTSSGPAFMAKTVDKMAAIMAALESSSGCKWQSFISSLAFSLDSR